MEVYADAKEYKGSTGRVGFGVLHGEKFKSNASDGRRDVQRPTEQGGGVF